MRKRLVTFSVAKPKNDESTVNIQGVNFSQTQQFITQNILLATCFYCIKSSSGLLKNKSNVSKCIVHSWISNAFGIPEFQSNTTYYTKYSFGNMFRLYWIIIRPSKKQIQFIKIYSAFWNPKRSLWFPKNRSCGRSPTEIVGSNPTGGMDICLLWVSCVVR
jgi:hypothetical protein